MAKGYYLVQGDMTSCGGKIIDGASDHCLFGKAVARDRDRVTCGQHPGMYMIAGGIANDSVHGRKMAGTLDSTSSCPCRARFVPSMMQDTYEKTDVSSSAEGDSAAASARTGSAAQALPTYFTGEKPESEYISDYPVLKNTYDLPDEKLRMILKKNNQDIMLLTLPEVFEILSSWGVWKYGWVAITKSAPGQIIINYGANIKDVVTTSMLVSQLGSFGIKATGYMNHKSTELIKISGYPGVRKIFASFRCKESQDC